MPVTMQKTPYIQADGSRVCSSLVEMQMRSSPPLGFLQRDGAMPLPRRWLLLQEGDASGWSSLGSRLGKGQP